MSINTKEYIEQHLKIKDKKSNVIQFKLNKPQLKLYNALAKQYKQGKPQRAIVLKARQMGFSTLTEAIIFKKTATAHNVRSGIVTHEISATNNLFNISKRYLDNLETCLKPEVKASNAKELIFNNDNGTGLDSSIKCMTAGNSSIGRSDTFQNLHISEYAFWEGNKEDTLTGLMQAVPMELNTMVIIESTANGYDDFKDFWDKSVAGENDFIPIFCAWWELDEYRITYDGFNLTEEEIELKSTYDLDDEQIAWRRWCIKNNCNNNVDKFRQEYPSNPQEAFIMSGTPVFNTPNIINRITMLEKKYKNTPYKQGYFSFEWNNPIIKDFIKDDSIHFIEDKNRSDIRIYEDVKVGYPYVIGGDTKGEGKDYFAGTAINNTTGCRVATLHMKIDNSRPFTYQMYCLGRHFNDALIGIEINFNTAPIEELERLQYPNQYKRQKYDDITKQYQNKFGWKTDGNTRPLIIDKEIDLINNNIDLFNDIPTLTECFTFVYDKNGRPDAIVGKHDDLLFSDMIANEIRPQQGMSVEEEKEPEKKLPFALQDEEEEINVIGGVEW